MSDLMTFPDTVEEFMEEYKIIDTEQVYTNGAELVPIFRMKQWFEHLPTAKPRTGKWIKGMLSPWSFANCSECGELCLDPERVKYCPNCGARMEKNND